MNLPAMDWCSIARRERETRNMLPPTTSGSLFWLTTNLLTTSFFASFYSLQLFILWVGCIWVWVEKPRQISQSSKKAFLWVNPPLPLFCLNQQDFYITCLIPTYLRGEMLQNTISYSHRRQIVFSPEIYLSASNHSSMSLLEDFNLNALNYMCTYWFKMCWWDSNEF